MSLEIHFRHSAPQTEGSIAVSQPIACPNSLPGIAMKRALALTIAVLAGALILAAWAGVRPTVAAEAHVDPVPHWISSSGERDLFAH